MNSARFEAGRRSTLLAGLGLLANAGFPARGQNSKEKNRMQQELRVEVSVRRLPDRLELQYSFENASSQSILVFDRFWDMRANALKPDWAYVEIQDGRASIRRLMDRVPQGLHLENPRVPYGREIGPHVRGTGSLSFPLPLQEHGEYDGFVRPKAQLKPAAVHEILFELGWVPKPASLPPAVHPVEMNNEMLWLLSYRLVSTIQRVAASSPVKVDVPGEAFH